MALWDQIKQNATDALAQGQSKIAQFKSAEFANASMAMCALIAAADGNVDASERQKIAGLITSNETLKVFPAGELKTKFDFHCAKAASDLGRIEVLQTIAKLKTHPDQARAVIQIGLVIGAADGHFDEHEQKAVRDACAELGISPTEFNV